MSALARPQPISATRTTCPYCGVGCGVIARPDHNGSPRLSGDPAHPSNFGRLCSKGSALDETLSLDQRLLFPMMRQSDGALARVGWDAAIERVADGLRTTAERHGPDAIAFYLSGQLLTEDYYVANKLMKGFLGSANVDTNSRLCMASSVAGHRRAFGADTVPGVYRDLDEADLIVLVGSNAAWCHPVLFQRMIAARRQRGTRLIVIDPRKTATAEDADLFLPIAPGLDTALFCGLLSHLAATQSLDARYIDNHTNGFDAALAHAREIAGDIAATARASGLSEANVEAFFSLFRATERVVTCYSQGVNQSAQGTDKVNAIINVHLATGRIGRPGMGPFSLTGQPNAMGGREVGGLANQLAAHMGFSAGDIDRVRRFWNAPHMAQSDGLKAVDLFDAVARGEIKALWVMATNPAVSMPRASAVREAFGNLDLFVVSDNTIANDTVAAGPDVLLPAAAWGEKDGTVTNSERRISRQRGFLPLPGEARPDWWIVTAVARRMGFASAFDYRGPADIFREHAALSAFENDGERDFDIGALQAISDRAYQDLEPVMWPARIGARGNEFHDTRFFGDGRFFTADRRARFVAPQRPEPRAATSPEFPYRLNTGRVRDHWHTMTRTGLSPRLAVHTPGPFVAIHPDDAARIKLTDDGFAKVTSAHGEAILKVSFEPAQQPGSVFVPIHWSDATATCARAGALVMADCDPLSGQPEMKLTPARLDPIDFAWRGFLLTRRPATLPRQLMQSNGTWFARIAVNGGYGLRFATNQAPETWHQHSAHFLSSDAELAEYVDERRGMVRMAAFRDGRLDGCIFIGPAHRPPSWDAVLQLFAAATVTDEERRVLLSGRRADGWQSAGPVICACHGVGSAAINAAIAGGCDSVEALGQTLRAGTNCGSCIPEIRKILHQATPAAA
jgi:assimilatory nitrate reductase catalytic subunit